MLLLTAAPAWATTYYVTAGGTYPDIQSGINAAANTGDIVEVDDGVWSGASNVELDFMGRAITVRSGSGNPNACYINCNNSARGVDFQTSVGRDSVFEGIGIINGRADHGGAIRIGQDCSPTIRNVYLGANGADFGGAILIKDNSTALIEDSKISNNHGFSIAGGAVYVWEASPTFRNTEFVNNDAPYGGAVCACFSDDVTFEDCLFSANDATKSGGAISLSYSTMTLSECTVHMNTAVENGGGVILIASSSIDVTGGIFSDCESALDGGAVHMAGSSATFTGVQFEDHKAGKRGGAVYGEGGATMTFEDECKFLRCTSGWGGGAIFSSDSAANITNCDFEENSAGAKGGALRYRDGATGQVTGGSFTGNHSNKDGGAIAVTDGATITVNGPSFTSNNADSKGGAIAIVSTGAAVSESTFSWNEAAISGGGIWAVMGWSETFYVEDCDFDNNEATDTSTGRGGGIALEGGALAIARATFKGNRALSGGGIDTWNSHVYADSVDFWENSSPHGSGRGGGASHDKPCPDAIRDIHYKWSRFIGNEVYQGSGGGFWVKDMNQTYLHNCGFFGNSTDQAGNGGGMYLDTISTLDVANCAYSYNTAAVDGGAVYVTNFDGGKVDNCSFSRNDASGDGGGIHIDSAFLDIDNCIFYENEDSSADYRKHIFDEPYCDVDYSCFYPESWPIDPAYVGNICQDPMFVEPDGVNGNPGDEDDDLRLSAGSPCIDAANSTQVSADLLDLDGDGPELHTPLDLDRDPRFLNDTGSPDTGVPDLPLYPEHVDMGAYEFQGTSGGGGGGDVNGDGVVDINDLFLVLGAWGDCQDPEDCPEDVNDDGVVDIEDVFYVLAHWGPVE